MFWGGSSLQPITNEVLHHKAANMVIDRRYYINCDVYLSTHGKHSTSPLRRSICYEKGIIIPQTMTVRTAIGPQLPSYQNVLFHVMYFDTKKNRIALTIFVYELLLNKLNTGISISYTYSTSLLFFISLATSSDASRNTTASFRVLHKRIYLHST